MGREPEQGVVPVSIEGLVSLGKQGGREGLLFHEAAEDKQHVGRVKVSPTCTN